MGTKVFIGV